MSFRCGGRDFPDQEYEKDLKNAYLSLRHFARWLLDMVGFVPVMPAGPNFAEHCCPLASILPTFFIILCPQDAMCPKFFSFFRVGVFHATVLL